MKKAIIALLACSVLFICSQSIALAVIVDCPRQETCCEELNIDVLIFNDQAETVDIDFYADTYKWIKYHFKITICNKTGIVEEINPEQTGNELANEGSKIKIGHRQLLGGRINLADILTEKLKENELYTIQLTYIDRQQEEKNIKSNIVSMNIVKPTTSSNISRKKVIEIAQKAIAGKINYDSSLDPAIEQIDDIIYVVFPNKLAKGLLGSDFSAKVMINPHDLSVIRILAAP